MEGNLRFKTDWASLIVGSEFTVFALFHFEFEGNFLSTSPRGAYIWRGYLTEGFFALPVWGACIWRGLYMEGLIFGILRYSTNASSLHCEPQKQIQSSLYVRLPGVNDHLISEHLFKLQNFSRLQNSRFFPQNQ